ncbi:MAG: type I restriction-modification system subunit M N-terminal domain-containing protein [Phormidesmis sp.]
MTNASNAIVSKVWSFCNALRDDGVGYGDYLEQLTYLIFLKMADEYSQPPHNKTLGIPEKYSWASLTSKSGAELETHYNELLRELAKAPSTLGQIFLKAQNKIQNPAMLYKIISMIDSEKWTVLGADVKDKSLADLENLPDPDILAEQIIENLEAGLGSFRDVLSALQP